MSSCPDRAKDCSESSPTKLRIPVRMLLLPRPADLAIDQFLQVLRVSRSLHRNLRSGTVDLAEIVGCQLNGRGADVFFQPVQLRCAGDGNDPRLLREQPGERDLRRRRFLLFGDLAEQIDQGLIRFAVLRREARDDVAEIGAYRTWFLR